MEVFFATSNRNKYSEARSILGANGIEVMHFPFEHREIRSDSLSEIAEEAASAAYAQLNNPVFVEDAGLFIESLNGFPGTFSGWVQKKLGSKGILKLMEGMKERGAQFKSAISFYDGKAMRTFEGMCEGSISEREIGSSGFGYDPIFIPKGHSQTFAQNIELKNKLSHRYNSLLKLSEYLKEATF